MAEPRSLPVPWTQPLWPPWGTELGLPAEGTEVGAEIVKKNKTHRDGCFTSWELYKHLQ